MASLVIEPTHSYESSKAAIKRPTELSYFSYDKHRNFHEDLSSLKYYYTPRLGASLSAGFNAFNPPPDKDEHLDGLLESIMRVEAAAGKRVESDFVTWRGMVTKIMTAPYSDRDGFQMRATLFENTIFIEEDFEVRQKEKVEQYSQLTKPGNPSQELMAYWGHKFETLSLLPDTWDATSREFIENRETHPVDNSSQFCLVVETGIGHVKMILGGEVDAVWDVKQRREGHRTNWIELKTSAEPNVKHQMISFERKLLRAWAQSFLLGVPKIIFGFRSSDETGRLLSLQEFETRKIPSTVQTDGYRTWDMNVCINFTSKFLSFLKNNIHGDGVWIVRRLRNSREIQVFEEGGGHYKDILSAKFVQWRLQFETSGLQRNST